MSESLQSISGPHGLVLNEYKGGSPVSISMALVGAVLIVRVIPRLATVWTLSNWILNLVVLDRSDHIIIMVPDAGTLKMLCLEVLCPKSLATMDIQAIPDLGLLIRSIFLYIFIVSVVSDPRQWTENHVAHWLQWAAKEFSLDCIPLNQFRMKGKDICAMGKDAFSARAPAFVGDILWEHLELLQKGLISKDVKITASKVSPLYSENLMCEKEGALNNPVVSSSMYEPMCVPELGAYIDYTQAPGVLPGEDRKPVPVSSISNATSSPSTPQSTNNNFLHE
ncbi:hypothetical protein NQ317_013179, partial [Molorchus minor]